MNVIIYKNNEGGVAIVYPSSEATIEAVANAVVPAGAPFKIVDITELPLDGTLNADGVPNIDKTFRSAWEWTE